MEGETMPQALPQMGGYRHKKRRGAKSKRKSSRKPSRKPARTGRRMSMRAKNHYKGKKIGGEVDKNIY